MRSKYLICMAINIRLLLLGCERFVLMKKLIRKLEAFHLKYSRRILKVKLIDVLDDHIINSSVIEQLYNNKSIDNSIVRRR